VKGGGDHTKKRVQRKIMRLAHSVTRKGCLIRDGKGKAEGRYCYDTGPVNHLGKASLKKHQAGTQGYELIARGQKNQREVKAMKRG